MNPPIPRPIPYLDILPAELWIACWNLCSNSEVRSISAVCKLFRSICLPLLLRDQVLDVSPSARVTSGDWAARGQQLEGLATRLHDLVEYAPLVRSWKAAIGLSVKESTVRIDIEDWCYFDSMYNRILTVFGATLGLYRNLYCLHLEWFVLDEPFLATLAALPMLEELFLQNCDLASYEDGLWLGLKAFTELGSYSTADSLRIADPTCLQTLRLQGSDIFRSMIVGFGTAPNFTQLVDFSLEELTSLTTFFGVLRRCPRLESLKITSIARTAFLGLDSAFADLIEPTWIPLLRSIAAPSIALIRMIVPRRPVRDVAIYSSRMQSPRYLPAEEIILLLMDIASSAAPLHSLVLPGTDPTLACFAFITRHFPQLRKLSMIIQETGKEPIEGVPDSLMWHYDHNGRSREHLPESFPVFRRNQLPDITSASNIHNILRWIFGEDIALPVELEVLELEADVLVHDPFTAKQHRQVAKALRQLCPDLRELRLHRTTFKRTGNSWKDTSSEA
ncbi:hypothetical protein R3P38DRAFT_2910324 [Favolaschia claudopus]|uniref:F-box domain-containing protein n=1 Tax=Favolaschia claudopus TaxID=2862362 RepID=A0AAW0C8M4_9AGAR